VFPIVHYCPNTMLSTCFHLEHERDWRKRAINETEKSVFLQPINIYLLEAPHMYSNYYKRQKHIWQKQNVEALFALQNSSWFVLISK